MKFITGTDLHLTSGRPSSRIDTDFPEELFELLEQLLQAAIAVSARAILLPGDITHVRRRIEYEVLARFIGWCFRCKKSGIDVLGIPGNHDLLLNRYETLESTPLGLFFQVGAVRNLSTTRADAEASIVYYSREPHLNASASVEGVPFPDAFSLDKWRSLSPGIPGCQRIVMGHCFANRDAGVFFGDPVHSYEQLLDASGADYIVLGHDHTDRGVAQFGGPNGPRYVIDIGALSRGSMDKSGITRVLKFCVIDTDARSVQAYRLNYRPAEAIFDLAKREREEQEAEQVQTFIAQLQADLATTGTPVASKLDGLSLPSDVRDRVEAYIEQAEQAQKEQLAG